MVGRAEGYDAFWIPDVAEADRDLAVEAGAEWLWKRRSEGTPLVLLDSQEMINNNQALQAGTTFAVVAQPLTLHRKRWAGGPVLAPWPSERVLAHVDRDLARKATAVCVIEWTQETHVHAWVAARGAVDLSGQHPVAPEPTIADPVVRVAMESVASSINQNNGLIQSEDKAVAVRALQVLHDNGHVLDPQELFAWASARDWVPRTPAKLREYADGVRNGHRYQINRFHKPTVRGRTTACPPPTRS